MRARTLILLWISIYGVLGLTGCANREPAPSGAGVSTANPTLPTSPGPGPPAEAARNDVRVVRTASLELRVADVSSARTKISEVAKSGGGFVKNAELSNSDEDAVEQAELCVRVPVERFDETLRALSSLATRVAHEHTTSEDVTEAHVDLTARLAAKRRIEGRYIALLERAQTVKDVLEVEKELGNLRVEIEQLEGKKTLLESQSALATIDIILVRDQGRVTASFGAIASSLLQAGKDSINGAATLLVLMIRALGYGIPILLLLGIPGYLLSRAIAARRRRSHGTARAF